jgi:hypothetical protein
MILEALLVSLIVSISLFLFEFFKMKSVLEQTLGSNQLLPGFGLNNKLIGAFGKSEKEIDTQFSRVSRKFDSVEDRLSRQENVIERLIKEISDGR